MPVGDSEPAGTIPDRPHSSPAKHCTTELLIKYTESDLLSLYWLLS